MGSSLQMDRYYLDVCKNNDIICDLFDRDHNDRGRHVAQLWACCELSGRKLKYMVQNLYTHKVCKTLNCEIQIL